MLWNSNTALMGFIHLCGAHGGKWPGLASFVFIGFIDLLLEPTQFLYTQSGSLLPSLWCDKTETSWEILECNPQYSLVLLAGRLQFKYSG